MMELKLYQVDAFSDQLFGGNPAAVVPLAEPLNEELMQKIAAENNLAETAFFYPQGEHFRLRWFTPTTEVPLCGHATLASAYVLFECLGVNTDKLHFECLSGSLFVTRTPLGLRLDFPLIETAECESSAALKQALGGVEHECFITEGDTNLLIVLKDETELEGLDPELSILKKLSGHGVIVTAKSSRTGIDFVSRYFAPSMGIDEDPVTGSIHCALTPFWAQRLGKPNLVAEQLSARKGKLWCSLQGDRVLIEGSAKLYMEGVIFLG